jgi:DNA-binding CsgD family transcriptional regulator
MTVVETDLSSLNDHERTVLGLLAQGHTVKSIATLTRRSEASVNERLREARRKTGVGSSRELARLLREQVNRDEEIGVAAPAPASDSASQEPARRGLARKGLAIMTSLVLAAAAAFALLNPLQTGTDLHERFQRETRDSAWAAPAEAALLREFGTVHGVDQPLKAECRATLCEVSGRLQPGLSDADTQQTLAELQGSPLLSTLEKQGLQGSDWHFATSETGPRVTFRATWQRI